ncbi:hypothetical protein GCM10010303_72350 [Streptomyces purpurascens]|nr:hypothetical protein GCM10010303_72350 [Streptomyces purpurascens]
MRQTPSMPGLPGLAAAGAAAAAARARVRTVAVTVRMIGSPVEWSCISYGARGSGGGPSGGLVDGGGDSPLFRRSVAAVL